MKIKAAQVYVLGVKKTRAFFLGVLFVSVSFVFLINGLSLIQTAFFTYSMWSIKVKFILALVLGGIEFLGAIGILIYLFREETWGKFSGIQKVVDFVIDEEGKDNKT
jgi:cytochrome c biogenesis protein CcdA